MSWLDINSFTLFEKYKPTNLLVTISDKYFDTVHIIKKQV